MLAQDRYIYRANQIDQKTQVMKIEILKVVTFVCMFIVLGMQALLHGSWRVNKTEPIKSNQHKI